MTERENQADDAAGVRHRRVRSLRRTFRVDEIRARSTPQLVAIVAGMATLATGFAWTTTSLIRGSGPHDWRLPAALFVDLVVVVCVPGVLIAAAEVMRRIRHLLAADGDGPLLTRCARAVARFAAQARTDTDHWFDDMNVCLVLVMLITPLLYAGFGVFVAIDGIRYGWTSDMRVLVAIGVIALLLVPAALGSLIRRRRRRSE